MDHIKYYDLTPGQKLLLFSQSFTVHKQINNIFTLTLVEKKLDFYLLKSAIELAYEQNDAFRLRITKNGRKIQQYFADREKPDIKTLDFTGQTEESMDKCLHAYAKKPIRIFNRSMTRVFLVHSWNGLDGIYFGVSHLILDSWGICVFLQYVMEVYDALLNSTPLPKPLKSLESLLQKDLMYVGSAQEQKDREFWQNEFGSKEPSLISHINGPALLEAYRKKKKDPTIGYANTFSFRTAGRHEVLYVPKEDVEKIQAFCDQQRISMQSVFMLGVRTALSKLNNRQKDIGIYMTNARRGTLEEKRTGGSRVHSSIFRTIFDEEKTFEQACQETYSYQMRLYRHAEFGTVEMIGMEAQAYNRKGYFTGWHTTVFTFQPIKLVLKDGTPLRTKWYCNGASSSVHYLTMMDADATGALRCYYEYQKHTVTARRVREFHSLMTQAVMAGVSNPTVTLGAILDTIDQNIDLSNVAYFKHPKDIQVFGAAQQAAEK